MLPSEIPEHHRKAAYKQWMGIAPGYIGWLALHVFAAPLVAATSRPMPHPIPSHPTTFAHAKKYIDAGSSGMWQYHATPYKLLDPFNVYEDGTWGEDRGKHSAAVGGQEHTFISQCKYLYRNPINKMKRTSDKYSCFINECDINWIDSRFPTVINKEGHHPIILSDKAGYIGWEFVWATHRVTKKVYYGYRHVKGVKDQTRVGFKIKSAHSQQDEDGNRILQGPSDLDKSFTAR